MSFASVNFPSVVVSGIIHHLIGSENYYMDKWMGVSPILSVNRMWRDEYIRNACKTVFIESRPDVQPITTNMVYGLQFDNWKFTNIGHVAQLGYTSKTKTIRIDACIRGKVQKQLVSLVNDQVILNYIKNYDWSNVESLVVTLGIDNEYDFFDNTVLQVNEYKQMIVTFAKVLHNNLPNVKELVLSGCDSSLGSDTLGKELVCLFGPNLTKLDCPYSQPILELENTDKLESLKMSILTDIKQISHTNMIEVSRLKTLSLTINENFNWDCFTCDKPAEILVFPKLTELTIDYIWEPNHPEATFHPKHVEFPKLQKLTVDFESVANPSNLFRCGTFSWPKLTNICVRNIGNLKDMAKNLNVSIEFFVENLAKDIVQSVSGVTILTILDSNNNEDNEHFIGLLVANYQHQLQKIYSKIAISTPQPIILTNLESLAINMKIPKAGCLIKKCAHLLCSIKLFNAPFDFSWGIIYDGNKSTDNIIEFANLRYMYIQFAEFGMSWTQDMNAFVRRYKLKDKYAAINCPRLTEIRLENSMIHTMKQVLSFNAKPWTEVNSLVISLSNCMYVQTNSTNALVSDLYNLINEYSHTLVRYMPNIKRLNISGGKPVFLTRFSQTIIERYANQLDHIECGHALPPSCLSNSRCKSLDLRLESDTIITHGSINTSQLEVFNLIVPSTLFSWKLFEGKQQANLSSLREITICSFERLAYRQLNQKVDGSLSRDNVNVDIYIPHVDNMLIDLALKGKEVSSAIFHINSGHNIELNGNVANLPFLSRLERPRIRYLTLKPIMDRVVDLERFYEFTNSWLGKGANVGYASLILNHVGTDFNIDTNKTDWSSLSELFVGKNVDREWILRIVSKYPELNVKWV